jgi:hypothetical protein
MPCYRLKPGHGTLQKEKRGQVDDRHAMIERGDDEADEPHVVIERQPRHADIVVSDGQAFFHDALDVRGEVRMRQ